MITITRRQARRLRAVFRRHALGIAHRGPVPPLVFRADPDVGLRVRHHLPDLAIEHVLPGTDRPEASIALPLDALADFEGKDDVAVILEAAAPGRTVVRWEDRGIPQTREYAVPELVEPAAVPRARRRRSRPAPAACSTPWPRPSRRPTRARPATRWTASSSRATPARWWPPTAGRSSSRAASASPGRATCWSAARRCSPAAGCRATCRSRWAGRTPTSCSGPGRGRSGWRSGPTAASRASSRRSPPSRRRPPGSASTPRTPRSWAGRSTGSPAARRPTRR